MILLKITSSNAISRACDSRRPAVVSVHADRECLPEYTAELVSIVF